MYLDIKNLVDKNFPNKNQFAKTMGIGYPAACKLYDGNVSKINFDTLENLCIVLKCTPSDILKSDSINYNTPKYLDLQSAPEEYIKIDQLLQLIDSRVTEIINKKDGTE